MSASQVINLVLEQGADFEDTFTVRDSDGLVIDMSGYSAEAQMRRHHESNSYHSFAVNTTSTGLKLSMSATATADVEPGQWVYDVVVTSTANVISKPVSGKVNVKPLVTR